MRMRAAWPALRCTLRGRAAYARLVCRGRLRPSSVTRAYDIAVAYRLGAAPLALVEQPALIGRADQGEIPHTYVADEYGPLRPCLYYPRDGDWSEDRALAWTIIPWLLEWLVEYEVWLVTGEWCGGGVAHAGQAVGDHDTRTLGDGAPTVTGEAAHD